MKYSFLILFPILLFSCQSPGKQKLVVYPEYCHGCILRNFMQIKKDKSINDFVVYLDTSDSFLRSFMKRNGFKINPIKSDSIKFVFGDYSNILFINLEGKKVELKTNETLIKGVNY